MKLSNCLHGTGFALGRDTSLIARECFLPVYHADGVLKLTVGCWGAG